VGFRRRGDHWVWVGGPVPPGSDAITIWSVISVRRAAAGSERLLAHEEEHVRQWRRLGAVRFLREYLGAYAGGRWKGFGHTAAYRLIPLEIEAEEAAVRFMAERRRSSAPPPPPPSPPPSPPPVPGDGS
jgi:hypothetical protein